MLRESGEKGRKVGGRVVVSLSGSFETTDKPLSCLGTHGLRTPNEGINQRYLKNCADVADKICFGVPKNLGVGSEFSAMQ